MVCSMVLPNVFKPSFLGQMAQSESFWICFGSIIGKALAPVQARLCGLRSIFLQVILAPVGPLTTRLTITASSALTMQFTTTVESRSQMLTVLLSAHF